MTAQRRPSMPRETLGLADTAAEAANLHCPAQAAVEHDAAVVTVTAGSTSRTARRWPLSGRIGWWPVVALA